MRKSGFYWDRAHCLSFIFGRDWNGLMMYPEHEGNRACTRSCLAPRHQGIPVGKTDYSLMQLNTHTDQAVLSLITRVLAEPLKLSKPCLYWYRTPFTPLIFRLCARSGKSSISLQSDIVRTKPFASSHWFQARCPSTRSENSGQSGISACFKNEHVVPKTSHFAGLPFCTNRISHTMGISCHLYLPGILLMRAGDIETNPGPNNLESQISKLEILELSKEINPADYHSLGTSLGIKLEQHDDNPDTFLGLLMEWNTGQHLPEINKREVLADSLQKIGRDDLSDKLRSGRLIQKVTSTTTLPLESAIEPLSPELIERCRKDFMLKYETTLCRITSDPLNPVSLLKFQEIYTNLVLEEEQEEKKEKEELARGKRKIIQYNDLLKLEVNGKTPKRLLVQGEAGAGKTTLCAKIAWDWINEMQYQQFVWVLIVPLRESEDYTMGEIAKSYLSEDNPTTTAQLTHYIRSNPDNVFIAYDGLDEFKGQLKKKGRNEARSHAHTQRPDKHTPQAGGNARLESPRFPGSHSQKSSAYAQQTDGRSEQMGYIEQPEGYTQQPKGYTQQRSVHPHRSVVSVDQPGNSTEQSGAHTKNPFGCTEQHDPTSENSKLVIEDIICSDQLETCTVLITTRPWKAHEIRGDTDLGKVYAFIRVDGFNEENMSTYIHKYFASDESKANDLIEFIKDNDVVSENMTRYPIFVAMLCLMWRDLSVKRQQKIKDLQTYSQFFGEMFMFLKEHYVRKITDDLSPPTLDRLRNETSVLLEPIAKLAFTGLLQNTLVFNDSHFADCPVSMVAACRVGVLSQENRITPMVGRDDRKPHVKSTVFFPHKLFQEYMAGVHLASLHNSDHNEYTNLMKETVLPRQKEFRYLLYFTTSQNKTVGIDVMTHMVKGLKERTDFLVDVAFESNDRDAVAVVQQNTPPQRETLSIDQEVTAHTIAGYVSLGIDMINIIIKRRCGRTVSHDVGSILNSSPSLKAITISGNMHADFYSILAKESPNIKVVTVCIEGVYRKDGRYRHQLPVEFSPSSSRDLAEAFCSMHHLNALTMKNMRLHDDFYTVMKEKASLIKVVTICLESDYPVERWDVAYMYRLSSSSSRDLAEALCSMHHLNALTMKNTFTLLHDVFYTVMKEKASLIKVVTICLESDYPVRSRRDVAYRLSSSSSCDLADALCSMHHLNALTMKNTRTLLHHDFYTVMKEKASLIKGSFPQVAKGQFKFNGVIQRDMQSLLSSFKKLLGIQSSDEEDTDPHLKTQDETVEFGKEEAIEASHEGGEGADGHEREDREYDEEVDRTERSQEESDEYKEFLESSKDTDDENHVEGFFGHPGGELSLETFGCILHIPPGALEEDSPIKITLEVLTQLPDDIKLEEDEMIVSPGFKCLPSGLHFKKPVKLIMPHCAVLNDPGKVKTVLYSWSHQTTGKVERIPQTLETCKVHQNHFELTLEHFCKRWVTLAWDWISGKGKLMCCMPYLPHTMPQNRKPLMELQLENKRTKELSYTKGAHFQPALDRDYELLIERQDLKVHCDHADEKHNTKTLTYNDLFVATKSKVAFNLDLRNIQENTTVTLTLTQTLGATQTNKEILFDTECIAPFKSLQSGLAGQTCSDEVPDAKLDALSADVPTVKYSELSRMLVLKHNQARGILVKHGNDYKEAIRECLGIWKDRTRGSSADLKTILCSAELERLWNEYVK